MASLLKAPYLNGAGEVFFSRADRTARVALDAVLNSWLILGDRGSEMLGSINEQSLRREPGRAWHGFPLKIGTAQAAWLILPATFLRVRAGWPSSHQGKPRTDPCV